ncbi:hypothetical protein JGS22_012555 [Streptomyces sp. P38-E01]|uniref:Uncharacterized protein n=1 Tax=Streptomyces tardus TaxID=2780544 RepID=A0A949JGC5_9ACTN|nr:hypothetical protein [Streptomyces tardus]MBU7598423.1 hypothetical protein [Streptomyces tardus]
MPRNRRALAVCTLAVGSLALTAAPALTEHRTETVDAADYQGSTTGTADLRGSDSDDYQGSSGDYRGSLVVVQDYQGS